MQSGIEITPELVQAFNDAATDSVSFVQMGIENDAKFLIAGSGNMTSSDEEDWTKMQEVLEDKKSTFLCKRDREDKEKWTLVSYIPEGAMVRQKMLFASSSNSLKKLRKFDLSYPISEKGECTLPQFEAFCTGGKDEDIMTFDEQIAKHTAYQHASSMSESKKAALVGVPIKVSDGVVESIQGLTQGNQNTVILKLDVDTEILSVDSEGDMDLASVKDAHFQPDQPRYIVHNYTHTAKGEEKTKTLFIYYCPGKAKPKLKMFYSTCKQNILKIFENLGYSDYYNLECDCAAELTSEGIEEELYPKEVASTVFKKPSARGRGRKKGAKFQG